MKHFGQIIFSTLVTIILISQNPFGQSNIHNTSETNEIEPVVFLIDSTNPSNQDKALNFYYADFFGLVSPVYISGKTTRLQIDNPTILLEASEKQLPFYIYPGEKINLNYVGSDSVSFYIKGNPERNEELQFFRNLVLKTDNLYTAFKLMPYQKKVNTLDSIYFFQKEIFKVKMKRLHILDSSATKHLFSKQFINLASTIIECAAFQDSLELYYQNRNLLIKLNLYKDLIQKKRKTFRSIEFMPNLFYFKVCEGIMSMALTGNPHYLIQNSSDFVNSFNFSKREFTGPTKDFMMYWCLSVAYKKMVPVSNEFLKTFNNECENELYKKSIANEGKENRHSLYTKGSNFLRDFNGTRTIDIKNLLSQNKGKVILLDFWASWCAPCRYEMSFSKKLKKIFNEKDVAFIYISIDEVAKDWINASTIEKLENANNFLLINANNSTFISQYKILGIPRYILIGKDGKLISDDSPRPSDPELEGLIKKHL